MANKKAEILTMDGQVVSPITLATNVLLDDGRTAQDLLDSRDESMFSPTVTTSSSISKVGQGDNVDFSENIIDGAYKSCVLKGKTLVNHNAEGNNRNEYACMPSVKGSNLTVNGTVEGKVKSAILSGNTLVNMFGNSRKTLTPIDRYQNVGSSILNVEPNTKYFVKIKSNYRLDFKYRNPNQIIKEIKDTNSQTFTFTSSSDTEIVLITIETNVEYVVDVIMLKYQDGMENWDIPYFEGMQSVKMPVLTTVGKNLYPDGDLTINNPKTSVWYYTNGVGSKFGQHCKRGDGGNWFYLTKGTYTYKATTKNTLTSIVLIGEGETVHPSGQEVKSGWYIFRFKTGAESVDYVKVLNLQLEKGSTSTTYEPYKSNILSCNEEVTLRGIGDVRDELDLLNGELTQRVYNIVFNESFKDRSVSVQEFENVHRFGINVAHISNNLSNDHVMNSICDKFSIDTNYTGDYEHCYYWGSTFYFFISKNTVDGTSEAFKTYITNNPIIFQTILATPTVKTVDLSDNVVHSYKDTTHYTCSSEEGSLLPTLAIEEGVRYKVIIKPSTKYSIVFNRTEVASGLTVDLGGATANITSTTLGKNIVQITTPPTLSHNYVIFKGLGNAIKDVQVIEGEVVGDEPYFEGMADVKNPIVVNVGKNLFDGGISNHYWNAPFTNGAQDISMQRADNCASTSRIRVRKGETYHLSGVNLIRNVVTFFKTKDSQEKPFHGLSANSFTSPYDGYIEWYISNDNINNPVKNVQIEAGSTTTPYEDYKTNILHTSEEVVLRSLPNGVSDTLDLMTGEYVQRIGEITLNGSETNWSVTNQAGWESTPNTIAFGQSFTPRAKAYNAREISSVICDKFATITANGTWGAGGRDEAGVSINQNNRFDIRIERTKLSDESLTAFKQWLSQNPITVQYEFETPITKTIDLKQHPFAYKDGYVVLTSSSEEISLTPTIEYSLIANRLGQIQTNQKLVEKQQAQIDELESMVITNLVNTQYQQALNEIKLGVK